MTIPSSPRRDSENVGITRTPQPSPSLAARVVSGAVRLTLHNALSFGSTALGWPLPFGAIEFAAQALPAPRGLTRTAVRLPHARAQLLRARGVAARTDRVVLYCHGGAFLCCGISTHLRLMDKLSEFSDSPVLAVDYRLLPKYTIAMALQDCHDAYRWLRTHGYEPEQIAIAGDSAGGYLALALAQRLLAEGETPAALALLSPLLQLDPNRPAADGPMLPHSSFAALTALIAAHDGVLYEPLEHIEPGLPPTLIHVSGAEELAYDAQLAARELAAAAVPVELGIWPGQIHVFQLAAPLVPEATRSLRRIGAFLLTAMSEDEEPESVA
ncbi:alpha/beta hydrolase [[Mycobacterium] nativiensis]|uniref:Alpha/beta hydrolase n=1 Tax=[Mycobacterium] nativiensis TaxID=2855503 RepID=A0ABU5XTH3_9MYCO|nr:alpha/beta hydrolase [Mycolicibacter sp. MYC340]MEB3031117.1 alpha/beta hydrolase [Mycolicibacter sp. MYC340]